VAGEEELSDRARDGLEHLQAAAKELIAATRALLDAAEELVDDPSAVAQLAGGLGALAKLAGGAVARAATGTRSTDADTGDDEEGSRVQRIRVS
jgi:hypothetical protein